MRRKRQKIDAQFLHVERDMPCGLHRVRVEKRAGTTRRRRELRDRHQRPDLVVCGHHADQRGFRAERAAQRLGRHAAKFVHAQHRDRPPCAPKLPGRTQNGVVLHGVRHDFVPPCAGSPRRTAQNPVVGLRTSRGEIDFARLRAERVRHRFPRFLQRPLRPAPRRGNRGGVAELFRQIRLHGRKRGFGKRRRGRVIGINPLCHKSSSLFSPIEFRPELIRFRQGWSPRREHSPPGKTPRPGRA